MPIRLAQFGAEHYCFKPRRGDRSYYESVVSVGSGSRGRIRDGRGRPEGAPGSGAVPPFPSCPRSGSGRASEILVQRVPGAGPITDLVAPCHKICDSGRVAVGGWGGFSDAPAPPSPGVAAQGTRFRDGRSRPGGVPGSGAVPSFHHAPDRGTRVAHQRSWCSGRQEPGQSQILWHRATRSVIRVAWRWVAGADSPTPRRRRRQENRRILLRPPGSRPNPSGTTSPHEPTRFPHMRWNRVFAIFQKRFDTRPIDVTLDAVKWFTV